MCLLIGSRGMHAAQILCVRVPFVPWGREERKKKIKKKGGKGRGKSCTLASVYIVYMWRI